MNYGLQIRETRKKLGITQSDLTMTGMSRVYITDLESGKAILEPNIPNKVERAYQISMKLMYFALVKNIPIDLEFDQLFPNDHIYFISKSCYESILEINNEHHNESSLQRLEDTYLNQPIDYLKFFLLKSIGETYETLKMKHQAVRVYQLALRGFKYKLVHSFVNIYKDTLYNYLFLVDDIENSREIVDLFEFVLSFSMTHNVSLNRYDYYNMALFSLKAFAYEAGLNYIQQQIAYYTSGIEDDVSYKIIQTGLLQKLERFDEAQEIYNELLTYSKLPDTSILLIHSNYINYIVKSFQSLHQLKSSMTLVENLTKTSTFISHHTYANLGQGYYMLNDHQSSYQQFESAFKTLVSSGDMTMYDYLTLVSEAYLTYLALGKCDELIAYIKNIDYDDLHNKEKNLLLTILINLLQDDCSQAKALTHRFSLSYR